MMGFSFSGKVWKSVPLLAFLLGYLCNKGLAAQCAPFPIAAKLGNVSLSNGQLARGIAYSVGTPEQHFAFLPQWPLNNVMIYGTNGKCTSVAPKDENGCTTWRGGQYNSLESKTRKVAESDTYPKDDSKYPSMEFISDKIKFNSNLTLSELPMGIALEDWGQEGYYPMMAIGLGQNSSTLSALKSEGKISSRTWSMFHGWTGATPQSQQDGTFVFGGYDRAKTAGKGYKISMTDHENCPSQLMVTIGDLIMNFPNGTTTSLFPTTSHSLSACIVPDYPVLMTIPLDPYFVRFEKFTDTTLSARSGTLAYYSVLYDEDDEPYGGDITIKLQSGPSIRIPNHQLVVPDKYIDTDTGAWTANLSASNLVLNPTQEINKNDMPILGRQFLSSAYIMVNQDAGDFTLWPSNPTDSIDLVSIGEDGEEITDFCSTERSVAPRPTSTPSTNASDGLSGGAIAGISVGAVAGIAIIGIATFFMCRRRAQKDKDTQDHTPPNMFSHRRDDDATKTVKYFEGTQHPYLEHDHYKPELMGSSPPPSHQHHYELAA